MKKLFGVGIVFLVISGISFVLSGIYYQINQDDIQKMKTTPVDHPGSSSPFVSHVPDFLRSDLDIIYGLIFLPTGIGIMIVSKYLK